MPTDRVNGHSRQISIRLTHDLDVRVQAYADDHQLAHGAAIMALVRKGLGDTESDTCHAPAPHWYEQVAQLTERVEVLETLARKQVNGKVHDKVGDVVSPNIDTAKHYLGPLCRNGHDFEGSRQSKRYRSTKTCTVCAAENQRKKNARIAGQVRGTA